MLLPPLPKASLTFPGYAVRSSVIYPQFCSFRFNSRFTLVPIWFLAACGSLQTDVFLSLYPLIFLQSSRAPGWNDFSLQYVFFYISQKPTQKSSKPRASVPFSRTFHFPLWVRIGCLLSHGSAGLYSHWRYKNLAHPVAV